MVQRPARQPKGSSWQRGFPGSRSEVQLKSLVDRGQVANFLALRSRNWVPLTVGCRTAKGQPSGSRATPRRAANESTVGIAHVPPGKVPPVRRRVKSSDASSDSTTSRTGKRNQARQLAPGGAGQRVRRDSGRFPGRKCHADRCGPIPMRTRGRVANLGIPTCQARFLFVPFGFVARRPWVATPRNIGGTILGK